MQAKGCYAGDGFIHGCVGRGQENRITYDIKYPVQSGIALMDFNESMRKTMSGFGPAAKSGADLAQKMKAIHGFPVATSTLIEAGVTKMTNSSEVTEVRHTPIPEST